jgi:threonine dehydratase
MTTLPTHLPISSEDVLAAGHRLSGIAHNTPVITSQLLNELTGREVFLKCESMQRTGSFKFRGAYNTIAQLGAGLRERGVVTASSGNHAQGVALAARLLGCRATILMPSDALTVKVEATRSYGAKIEFFDRQTADPELVLATTAEGRGLTRIPAYDHPHIMAGNGSAALELMHEIARLDALVVPVGGGGLLSGTLTIAKALNPAIAVFGVETEGADDTKQSLVSGERVRIAPPTTIADGMRLRSPGRLTFQIIRALVDDVLVVSDADVLSALRFMITRTKHVIEPSGAVPIAALLRGLVPPEFQRIGAIVSGGNIDPGLLATLWAPNEGIPA